MFHISYLTFLRNKHGWMDWISIIYENMQISLNILLSNHSHQVSAKLHLTWHGRNNLRKVDVWRLTIDYTQSTHRLCRPLITTMLTITELLLKSCWCQLQVSSSLWTLLCTLCLKNVPSLTGYNFNTHPPVFIRHVISRHSKIGYRCNFLNYLALT